MDSVKIGLPFPPSVNHAYPTIVKGRKPIRVKSAALRKWIEDAPQFEFKFTNPVTISYLIFFPDSRERDGQNYMKVPLDYLVSEGILEGDDRTKVVGEQWFDGGIDRENPRIEITIKEYKKNV